MGATYYPTLDNETRYLLSVVAAQQIKAQLAVNPYRGDMGQIAGALSQKYPWMDAGVVSSLAQGLQAPESPAAMAAAQMTAQTKKSDGWFHPGQWVKSATRTATSALSAPYQMVQGKFREGYDEVAHGNAAWWRQALGVASGIANIGDPFNGADQRKIVRDSSRKTSQQLFDEQNGLQNTSIGYAARNELNTGNADQGTGWFAGGGAARRQEAFARSQAAINGHAVTLGRGTAALITEPGTRPYNVLSGLVDAVSAWELDPFGKPLGAVAEAAHAGSTLKAGRIAASQADAGAVNDIWRTPGALLNAGAVPGVRRTVLTDEAGMWLNSTPGRALVEKMAAETDFNTLWHATGKKVPVDLLGQIAVERDPARVAALLQDQLGVEINGLPSYATRAVKVRNVTRPWRWTNGLPQSTIPLHDPDTAVEQIDRYQRNAKMPETVISKNNHAVALAASPADLYETVTDIAAQAHNHILTTSGLSKPAAKKLTTLWRDHNNELRKYFVDEVGDNKILPTTVVDESGKALPSPHLWNELLNNGIPLGDARAIRRATSKLGRVIDTPLSRPVKTTDGWKWLPTDTRPISNTVAALDFVNQSIFKPLALLRAAWTIRVVGEEQVRMAASGLDSVFAHPLSYLAWRGGVRANKEMVDATGHLMSADEAFKAAMSRGSANLRDPYGMVRTNVQTLFGKSDPQYLRAWSEEISDLARDAVAPRVAEGIAGRSVKTLDHVGDGVARPGAPALGGGSTALEQRNTAGWEGASDWFWHGAGQKFRKDLAEQVGNERLLDSRVAADHYLKTVYDRIMVKTGGHPELVDAIASGQLKGVRMHSSSGMTTPQFKAMLNTYTDHGPAQVKGDFIAHGRMGGAQNAAAAYDRAVESMFNALMSQRTNNLSRSPAFKQFYWKRLAEVAGSVTREDAARMVANAEKAGMKGDILDLIRSGAAHAAGTHSLADLDTVAKGHALDSTRNLLYDLHEKSQWADITRNIFPFAEAWKEVLTRWATISAHHPQVFERGNQMIQGAEGSGFFYPDDQGVERFAYPGSAWVTKQVTGVPVGLSGTAAGLNIFSTSVLPGVGPLVQIPAAHLLPNTPATDRIKQALMPAGAPDTSGGALETFLPRWARTALSAVGVHNSPEDQRRHANTVMSMAESLLTTGKYDINSQAGQAKLLADAKHKTALLELLGAAARNAAPSAPRYEFHAKDATGTWVAAQVLRDDLNAMQKQLGYDGATQAFLQKYGPDAVLYLQGHTRQVIAGVEPTDAALDWGRQHKGFRDKYALVYGWLAPSGGNFDYNAYRAELDRGERVTITPEQQVKLANSRVASLIYYTARAALGPSLSQAQRLALHDFQDTLKQKYPGYGDVSGLPQRAKTGDVINQLAQAIHDPDVAGEQRAQVLQVYFTARDNAIKAARDRGLTSFDKSVKTQDIRDWLNNLGSGLAAASPDFARVWEQLLSREVDGK